MYSHTSVLLKESINGLKIEEGKKYIDATLGGGGHTFEILSLKGVVLGLDMDNESIVHNKHRFRSEIESKKLIIEKSNFKDIDLVAKEKGFERVSGILFDLGVSSYQVDTASRGFSYINPGPLDMRMDKDLALNASDLVNALNKDELIKLFNNYGDEYRGKDIAERIIREREKKPIKTTDELVRLLAQSYRVPVDQDFAKAKSSKKVFQALRIAVNDEIFSLTTAIPKAFSLLENGGRLCMITFHSLEDRVVKKEFKRLEIDGVARLITKKPIYPSEIEIDKNKRSKSAKLRIIEKI